MTNTTLFATLIGAISSMDDVQMSTMLGYANQLLNTKPESNTKPVKSDDTKSKLNAKNQTISFNVAKNVISIDGFIPKDVFGVVRDELKTMGVEWAKGVGFTFKTAKAAKEYAAKRQMVTAEERNNFRKEVYGWA